MRGRIEPQYDRWQFDGRLIRPASASTCISWADFQTMHVNTQGAPFSFRRSETPEWALRDALLREVIVAYLEQRAHIRRITGTTGQRLQYAAAALCERIPKMNAALDSLCRKYMEETDSARKRALQIEIEGLDSAIRVANRGPSVLAAVAYLYFRVGLCSADVAAELELKPPHIRQILHRMNEIAEELSRGPVYKDEPIRVRKPKLPKPPRRGVSLRVIVAGHLRARGWPWEDIARFLGVRRAEALLTGVRKAGLYIKVPRQGAERTPRRLAMNSIIASSLHTHGATWAFIGHLFGTQPSKRSAVLFAPSVH